MKFIKSLAISIATIFFITAVAGAQSESPRKFKHGGKIVTTYDKSTDITTVLLEPYYIKSSAGAPGDRVNSVRMTVGFTYSGNAQVGEPKVIEFVLDVTRTEPRNTKEPLSELTAEVDDQQIVLGRPQLLSAGNEHIKEEVRTWGTIRFSFQNERIGVIFPVDVFKKLAAAEEVRLRSGDVKVTLWEKQLNAFRDLASRIK